MTLLSVRHFCWRATAGRATWWWERPVAGRTRVEVEDLIGFFVNTELEERLSRMEIASGSMEAE